MFLAVLMLSLKRIRTFSIAWRLAYTCDWPDALPGIANVSYGYWQELNPPLLDASVSFNHHLAHIILKGIAPKLAA